MNFANIKKSRYYHKSTKSGKEENNPEEEELKKYIDVVDKLAHLFQNYPRKDLSGAHSPESALESSNNFSSNVRRTTSRTKEILNDRDFLINFMNDDTMPILPKNMHLLTDDDTNLNIEDKTKFLKLADLLLDDKETVKESFFINTVEEKMILKLYTALSRKSKDIFMEENKDNKDINKKRILLHKLNNIEIPRFYIEDKDNINNININENQGLNLNLNFNEEKNDDFDDNDNSILKKLKKKQKRDSNPKITLFNTINILTGINNLRRKSKLNSLVKEKLEFNPDCKYNKKNKEIKIIKIPSLEYKPNRYHNKKSRKNLSQVEKNEQWEPDIDGDLLAYINHNIVKIEDIYNKGKEDIFELKENQDEEVKPIEAKEITYDINQSQNEDESDINGTKNKSIDNVNHPHSKRSLTNISDEEDTEIKNKNKFCEYKDRLPNIIEISLSVEPEQKKISDFHKELKDLYSNRINNISELGEELFPSFGDNLKHKKIYKYVLNNERNEEISTDSFTLERVLPKLDSTKSKMELKLNLDVESESNKNSENIIKNNLSKENSENKIEKSQNNEINNNVEEQENKENENKEEKKDEHSNNIKTLNEDENDSNNYFSLEDDNSYDNKKEEQNKENSNNSEVNEENKNSDEGNKKNNEENSKIDEENKKSNEENKNSNDDNKNSNEANKKSFEVNNINNINYNYDGEEDEDDF